MIGLGQVGEFEVDREGLGDAVRVVDRQAADQRAGFGHQPGPEFFRAGRRRLLAVLDQHPAQALHNFEKSFAFLLHQNPPQ